MSIRPLHVCIGTIYTYTVLIAVLVDDILVASVVCKGACRVLTYLSHHVAMSIIYSGSKIDMHVYTNNDRGSDRDTGSSTFGYVVCLAGGPVDRIEESSYMTTYTKSVSTTTSNT